jgi:hypothetical protein
MIQEDYVSFKIAKLLKEKGFDEPTLWFYVGDGTKYLAHKTLNGDWYRRPTLQMAMKWLREVHNISIEPLVDFGNGNEYWWAVDVAYIKKNGLIDELCGYNSYEEACEAAIKYCLENLI